MTDHPDDPCADSGDIGDVDGTEAALLAAGGELVEEESDGSLDIEGPNPA